LVGTGGLTKTTADTVTLAAQNSYTGATTVSGGTLTLSGTSVTIGSTSGATLTGGTLLLNNTSSGYNGNRLPDTLVLTMNGGTLNFFNDGGAANFSEAVGRLKLASGASTVTTSQAASGQTSTLIFSANPGMTRSAGATVNFTGTGLGTDARNRIVFATAPTLDDGIIGGWAISGNDFAKYITSPATSVAPLAAADYYTGKSSTWTSMHNVKLTSTTDISGDTVINSLDFAQTAATSLFLNSNLLRVESGGILISGSFVAAIVGAGTLSAGTGANTAGELIIHQNSSSDAAISAVIADNGSGTVSLTKAGTGAGSLILYGNTYTGPTVIASGRMKVNTYAALGSPAAGTTVMNGATLELGSIGANMFEPVTLSGTGVSSSGALRGTATCVFNGPITLAGDTRINADSGTTLTLTPSNEPISGNYNLTFGGAGNFVVYTISIGTGTLTKDGTGILTLSSGYAYWGATTISEGTLRLGAANAIPSGSNVTVQGGSTLDIGAYGTSAGTVTLADGTITGTTSGLTGSAYDVRKGTISAHLGGSGGITKTTADTVTLAAANNYTGATTVSAGTLLLGANGAIPTGSSVTVQGGGTLDIGAYGASAGTVQLLDGTINGTTGVMILNGTDYQVRKGTISAHLVGTGELTKTTADTVTLSAANSYTGKTTISAGTLRLGADYAIPSASSITVQGGGTLDVGTYITSTGTVTLVDGTITGTAGVLAGSAYDVRNGAMSATLVGTAGLTKTTADTVTLAAANTYFGDTTISAGSAYSTSAGWVNMFDGTITGTTGVLTGWAYYV
ncbi:MAG: autotransporter-associated beta strand repeat-containing protein, partial [Planctomycetota bacterium]|nr:autotransporter-associated beta strand repeat-containing protein [Planctomycetota bacterium]